MPLINFKAIEGVLAPDKKRELIEKLTDATASVYGGRHPSSHLGRHRGRKEW